LIVCVRKISSSSPRFFFIQMLLFFKNVFVQGFKRKEKEEVPAAQESMEKSAGKEEVERSLNEEPKGVKESSK
jgi:hypothetical protein